MWMVVRSARLNQPMHGFVSQNPTNQQYLSTDRVHTERFYCSAYVLHNPAWQPFRACSVYLALAKLSEVLGKMLLKGKMLLIYLGPCISHRSESVKYWAVVLLPSHASINWYHRTVFALALTMLSSCFALKKRSRSMLAACTVSVIPFLITHSILPISS